MPKHGPEVVQVVATIGDGRRNVDVEHGRVGNQVIRQAQVEACEWVAHPQAAVDVLQKGHLRSDQRLPAEDRTCDQWFRDPRTALHVLLRIDDRPAGRTRRRTGSAHLKLPGRRVLNAALLSGKIRIRRRYRRICRLRRRTAVRSSRHAKHARLFAHGNVGCSDQSNAAGCQAE